MKLPGKFLLMTVALSSALTACVQMPTEKQSIVDQRPQITFRMAGDLPQVASAAVSVDGQNMGAVRDFLEGQASLRVLPGTHVIKVQSGDSILLLERAYLGDGVVRPFIVK